MTLNLRNTYRGSESLLALTESPPQEPPPVTVLTEPSEGINKLNHRSWKLWIR